MGQKRRLLWEMEERERPRERACEGDGEESWFQGANGDSAGYLQ